MTKQEKLKKLQDCRKRMTVEEYHDFASRGGKYYYDQVDNWEYGDKSVKEVYCYTDYTGIYFEIFPKGEQEIIYVFAGTVDGNFESLKEAEKFFIEEWGDEIYLD
jgi:hypothetical protein